MNKDYSKLVNYVDDLIDTQSYFSGRYCDSPYYLTADMLEKSQLAKIAYYFLELDERDTQECFYDLGKTSFEDEVTCGLIKLLNSNNQDNRNDFAELIVDRTINRYKDKIQELFHDRCINRWHEEKEFSKYETLKVSFGEEAYAN